VGQRRVLLTGFFPAQQVFGGVAEALQRKRLGEIVGGGEAVEQRLKRLGQRLIRRNTTGPQRVATKRRQQLGAKHRAERRGGQEGHVGVPHGVVAYVGDGGVEDQHFGLFRHVGVDRVDVQVAEVRREPRLLLRGDRLVTEEQHRVAE